MTDTAIRVGPTALTATAVTQRTVPGATTFVMRNIHVANVTTVPATFRMSIGADAAGTRIFNDELVPAGMSFDWSGFLPVLTGEIIQAYASAAASLTISVGGVDIT